MNAVNALYLAVGLLGLNAGLLVCCCTLLVIGLIRGK
jgi:hypothetical protein